MGKYRGIASVLGVLVATGNYSIVDRIANALNPNSVEQALYDALRTVDAMRRRAVKVKVKVDGTTEEVEIVDWTTDLEDPRYRKAEVGELVEVPPDAPAELAEVARREESRKIRFVRSPEMPSQEEIRRFLSEVRRGMEGLRTSREVAMMAIVGGGDP